MTDRELLAAYSSGSQQAFAELVGRHGAMVYAVCLRGTGNDAEANDVLQATFLVLARKAGGLRGSEPLSAWLFRVARNAALNARRSAERRRRLEKEAAAMRSGVGMSEGRDSWEAVRPHLDPALAALPAAQRNAIVLRYLQGLPEKEACRELGCGQSTLAMRISRGLEKLRGILARQGVTVPTATLAVFLAEQAQEAVPPALLAAVQGTVAGQAAASGAALQIAEGTMKAMMMAKVKLAAAVIGTVLAVGGGGGALAVKLAAGEPEPPMAEVLKSLPANKWVKLATKPQPGPVYCAPVYAPTRRQVLHWGGTVGGDQAGPNDVRAFDLSAGDWTSDYPSDPPQRTSTQGVSGQGAMLPSGRPQPSMVLNGVCWDSKREQVVYTMHGLMAAYDPKTKTWKDLKAKTVMPDRTPEYAADGRPTGKLKTEFDGGPPVYGMGTCYDPENDEILLFPHFDAKNISMREATGQITGHLGTFRYSFKDNTWRVVGDSFGSDEVKAARKGLVAVMAKASAAMDAAWALSRKADAGKSAEASKQFEAAAGELEKIALPAEAKAGLAPVAGLLKNAAAALSGGPSTSLRAGDAMKPARDALWAMNDALDGALRVEPPPRCAAPMVCDPKNKCIVMFGGHTNLYRSDGGAGPDVFSGQNDTWLYDVKTRQWREVAVRNRPPLGQFACRVPMLAYDDASGLVLLVSRTGNVWDGRVPKKAQLWTLDVAKGEWSRRLETDWPGGLTTMSGAGSEYPKTQAPTAMFGYDPKAKLMLIVQPEQGGQATYAMKLDLASLPSAPAPAWTPPTPIRPQEVPADDPAWVAKLKALPANTWVAAKPPKEPNRRDWGNLGIDPVRGWVVYQGGGHSSYQVHHVSIYSAGANRWANEQVGDHNAYIPPCEWEGSTIGYRGGERGRHERNTYQALDGRVYVNLGAKDLHQMGTMHNDPDYVRFYDIDRGGVSRELKIAEIERCKGAPESSAQVWMSDPGGRMLDLIGVGAYYGVNSEKMFFRSYDHYANKLVLKEIPKPFPEQRCGEGRHFCYLPDRDQIFLMNSKPEDPAKNYSEDQKKFPLKQVTFLYDVKSNAFSELPAKKTPPREGVKVVEYCQAQKCLLAVVGDQQWVYSFEKGDWAQLPMKTEGGNMGFQAPYGQMVWVERYGVFVNLLPTWVMRPDFSQIKWE